MRRRMIAGITGQRQNVDEIITVILAWTEQTEA